MRTSAPLYPGLIAITFLLAGCRKEQVVEDVLRPSAASQFGNEVQMNVGGVVVDEQGLPIEGAVVSAGLGMASTTTDANGVFRLNSMTGYARLGHVKVSKAGYFQGSRSFVPVTGMNSVRIMLMNATTTGTVQASAGGAITSGGVVVTLPAGAYLRNGVAYTGAVRVSIGPIDPNSPTLEERMPGALLGTIDGAARMLRSFGMVVVELSDPAGTEIELAPGGTALVEFPVPASMQNEAPPTIDLWHFDEAVGVWVKEGEAHLEGGSYLAEVAHFSWWNCDVPNTFVHLSGHVSLQGLGSPVSGARIVVASENMGSGTTYSNEDGYFGGMVPDDQALVVYVSIPCGQGTYEQVHIHSIAGLTQAHMLDMQVSIEGSTVVSGTLVDCEDLPVQSGYVMAGSVILFCSNGEFTFTTCQGSIDLVGVQQGNFNASLPQTITLAGGVFDLGVIQACSGNVGGDGVTDIDGNTYPTVVIGVQEWMAQDLRVTTYANGDPIPVVMDGPQWSTLSTGAMTAWGAQYSAGDGKLYNWYAVTDPRKVCPTGWHAPSDMEWKQLELALGMPLDEVDQTGHRGEAANVGGKLKMVEGWSGPNIGATNESGFSATPGGIRSWAGNLALLWYDARFWTTTEMAPDKAWIRDLARYNNTVYRDNYTDLSDKRNGLAVRCVRD
ncbi:MAG: hypothetical protein KDB95_04400 [Flavobacteriales bacterium]|nr:hypothetical protein [Flavobacteriales bacterium]